MVLTRQGLRFAGRVFPCSVGRGGVRGDKREGDGATPTGLHRIVQVLYRPDRMIAPNSWAEPIGPSDLWSDESGAVDYNRLVRVPYGGSHERLRRADPLYDIVLVTDWNWPDATAGKGSAIFLHQWRRPGFPTEGCIAVARVHIRWIAERVWPGTQLLVPEGMVSG
jgi:L,D-peptidoglycan transpeptidase YkuD (ErfK/YbiS/YcfS/YnhG family)